MSSTTDVGLQLGNYLRKKDEETYNIEAGILNTETDLTKIDDIQHIGLKRNKVTH